MVTNQNLVPAFLFDLYIHYRSILRRLVTIHNAADRQTDRAMVIGHLWHGIDDLKIGVCTQELHILTTFDATYDVGAY